MFDGDTFDAGALGEDGFLSAEVCVGTVLWLWPSSRPLTYGFPAPCPGRSRRNHAKSEHQAFSLVKEDSHLMSLGLRSVCLPAVSILRVVSASHDSFRPSRAVIFAGFTAPSARIFTLGAGGLALR
jgi:hypothetical protein